MGHELVAVASLHELLSPGWLPGSDLEDLAPLHHARPVVVGARSVGEIAQLSQLLQDFGVGALGRGERLALADRRE